MKLDLSVSILLPCSSIEGGRMEGHEVSPWWRRISIDRQAQPMAVREPRDAVTCWRVFFLIQSK